MKLNGEIIYCMLDTGADMTVWCGSQELFFRVFPKAELCGGQYELGGFGHGYENVDVYEVKNFEICDASDKILFQSMFFAMSFNRGFGCDLILSATVFSKTNYSILNNTDVGYPLLRIESPKDVLNARTQVIGNKVLKLYTFSDKKHTN